MGLSKGYKRVIFVVLVCVLLGLTLPWFSYSMGYIYILQGWRLNPATPSVIITFIVLGLLLVAGKSRLSLWFGLVVSVVNLIMVIITYLDNGGTDVVHVQSWLSGFWITLVGSITLIILIILGLFQKAGDKRA